MQHRIKTYADGFKAIEFCEQCGAEGSELLETSCKPVQAFACDYCGHARCQCDIIREKFRKAVDKHNSRN